jgi:Ca-activated chloride channel homolog
VIENSQTQKKELLDIEIVFDLSNSMLAEDIKPSRIDVARSVLKDFVAQAKEVRIGIILFAGKPFTSTPLTSDTLFLEEFVSQLKIETINQSHFDMSGTAIWDGLLLASVNLVKEKKPDTKEQVIILMTDGEANKWIDPLLALKKVKQDDIKVYTIGVWKDENTSIVLADSFSGFPQTIPVGPVDEETLKKISSETGGKYYRADSEKNLREIFRDIASLERSEIQYQTSNTHISLRPYILFCISLLLTVLSILQIYKPIAF